MWHTWEHSPAPECKLRTDPSQMYKTLQKIHWTWELLMSAQILAQLWNAHLIQISSCWFKRESLCIETVPAEWSDPSNQMRASLYHKM
jgi:hypothetical protein